MKCRKINSYKFIILAIDKLHTAPHRVLECGPGLCGLNPTTFDWEGLHFQIDSLREALHNVKDENIRLASERMKAQMARLPPLRVPKKPTGMGSQTGLVKIGDVNEKDVEKDDLKSLTRNTNHLLTVTFNLNEFCILNAIYYIHNKRLLDDNNIYRVSPLFICT